MTAKQTFYLLVVSQLFVFFFEKHTTSLHKRLISLHYSAERCADGGERCQLR